MVDDLPTNLAILNVVLREVYNVVTATNGPDALNLAASEEPDLIILDIMMPGMDGYEICDRLKANPFTKDIPVMFVTAMDQERQEAKGLAMGAGRLPGQAGEPADRAGAGAQPAGTEEAARLPAAAVLDGRPDRGRQPPQLRRGFRQGMAPRRAPPGAADAAAGRYRPPAGL